MIQLHKFREFCKRSDRWDFKKKRFVGELDGSVDDRLTVLALEVEKIIHFVLDNRFDSSRNEMVKS